MASYNISQVPNDISARITSGEKVYCLNEDRFMISRSKLLHIKALAQDSRMIDSVVCWEDLFATIFAGILFSAIGALFVFDSLTNTEKAIACSSALFSLFIFVQIFVYKIKKERENNKHRKTLTSEIQDLMSQVDRMDIEKSNA